MTAGGLADKIRASALSEGLWKATVHAIMRHEGYTNEEIDAAEANPGHTNDCEFMDPWWQCEDEHGRSHHPVGDRMSEISESYRLMFEEAGDLAALLSDALAPHVQSGKVHAAMDWMEIAQSQGSRILAAQDLHRDDGSGQCTGCQDVDPGGHIPWPCPTILTLTGVSTQ